MSPRRALQILLPCLLLASAVTPAGGREDVKALQAEAQFGTEQGITLVNAVDFHTPDIFGVPVENNQLLCTVEHYCRATGGLMVAPLELPNGAVLDAAWLYLGDSDCNAVNVTLELRRQTVNYETALFEAWTTLDSASSTGCPGYAQIVIHPNLTVRTVDDIGHDGDLEAISYYFYVITPPSAFGVAAHALELHWHRTISPAPALATFADVPTNHPAFREIEAAYAANVLRPCNTGKFCPDGAVTRAELAVYLARALGLHWPQ